MPEYISSPERPQWQKVLLIALFIILGLALFATLTQPAWRGQQMIARYKADCTQRHGVLIMHHQTFGDSYSCESYLGK